MIQSCFRSLAVLCATAALDHRSTDSACESWCDVPPETWDTKCQWIGCGGCDECRNDCNWWCTPPPMAWSHKCTWEGCRDCGACDSIATDDGGGSDGDNDADGNDDDVGGEDDNGGNGGNTGDRDTGGASGCRQQCPAGTGAWDASFTNYEGNEDFCQCGHGNGCPYICSGGGPGSSGGNCDASACSSGQYHFENDVWDISVTRAQAEGQVPYRAFAYLPFCTSGQAIDACSSEFTFTFAFRTTDIAKWSGYVKLLFWTDGFNFLGLLPPTAAGNRQSDDYLLVAYPTDDYPNGWAGQVVIEDGVWYSVKVTVDGSNTRTVVRGPGVDEDWSGDSFDVNPVGHSGPQLGVYSFDFGGTISTDEFHLELAALSGPGGSVDRHDCEYECLAGLS